MKLHIVTSLLLTATVASTSWSKNPRFRGLGDLAGGKHQSTALAISGDGNTVVGSSESARGREAVSWRSANGLKGLGDLPGGQFRSAAAAVSHDGRVIVGYGHGEKGKTATRWVAGSLSPLSEHPQHGAATRATDVSKDGKTIIGSLGRYSPRAFAWREDKGYTLLESTMRLSGKQFKMQSNAMSVAPNGRVVAGSLETNKINFLQACVWIDGKGVPIRVSDGGGFQSGFIFMRTTLVDLAMQKDAIDAIVGRYVHKNKGGVRGFWKGDRKLKWMEQNGRSLNWPNAVSGDGRLVVGRGKIQGKSLACVWQPDTGNVRSVKELATQAGIDTQGWKLLEAVAVSEDGKVIAGNGTNPAGQSEAWVLTLRSASSLTSR